MRTLKPRLLCLTREELDEQFGKAWRVQVKTTRRTYICTYGECHDDGWVSLYGVPLDDSTSTTVMVLANELRELQLVKKDKQ